MYVLPTAALYVSTIAVFEFSEICKAVMLKTPINRAFSYFTKKSWYKIKNPALCRAIG